MGHFKGVLLSTTASSYLPRALLRNIFDVCGQRCYCNTHSKSAWARASSSSSVLLLGCPCPSASPHSSSLPQVQRGERGRTLDVSPALLHPRLMFLLLLVAERGEGETYWSAANLRRASSKPHNIGFHFTTIFQPSESKSSPSTIYSQILCGFL